MRILFLVLCSFCANFAEAQMPIIYYDSGRITINGTAVSKATGKVELEALVGAKARSGNIGYINDPITGDRSKLPTKYTHFFKGLGFNIGWFNKSPYNLESFFLLEKSIPLRKNKRDKRTVFSGKVYIGKTLFSKELNLKDLTNEPAFRVVATGLDDLKHPYTLISYQNTILKCRFNEAGFLTDFGTHL